MISLPKWDACERERGVVTPGSRLNRAFPRQPRTCGHHLLAIGIYNFDLISSCEIWATFVVSNGDDEN